MSSRSKRGEWAHKLQSLITVFYSLRQVTKYRGQGLTGAAAVSLATTPSAPGTTPAPG
jgi:hypothetical protein